MKYYTRACLNIHSRHLHAPLRGIFGPNSGYIARYAPFLWPKSSTKWNAQLTESNFQTRSSEFLQSSSFYDKFYLPNISLEEYIITVNHYSKLGTNEEATEYVNNNYMDHCKFFLKKNIYFYDELSKYILDKNGELKRLDEYNFFKLRYYASKFLVIENESRNFFEEEIKNLKKIIMGKLSLNYQPPGFMITKHFLRTKVMPCKSPIGLKILRKYMNFRELKTGKKKSL